MALGMGMSASNRTWILKIVADVNDAKKGIDDIEKTTSGFADKAKGLGRAVVTALGTAAVIQFGKDIVTAASDSEQALGAARSVFKEFSGEIESYGKNAAENLGISNAEFLQLSSLMGSLLKNAGVPLQQTTKMTEDLTARASDLAAMYGGNVADAVGAVNSALKGEYDPLESFGVSLKASTVSARAMAEGYVDASGKVTQAGMAIAAQELIMEQSADAAGTFAREGDTLAGQTQRMQAQFKDLQATLGTALLPVMVQLLEVIRPIIEFISQNTSWLIPLTAAILGVVVAVKAWSVAQLILNSALFANPVGLIILAIAALGAAIVVLVKNWDTVKDVVKVVTDAIVDAWNWVVDKVTLVATTLFDIYTWPYRKLWEFVQQVIGWIVDAWYGFGQNLGRVLGGIYDVMTYPFRAAWGYISSVASWMRDAFYGIPGFINSAFGGLYDIITYPFRRAMDSIKWLWNTTVGGFGFTIPSWVPLVGGREFKIPKMATGGIVTRPTIALIGEAGPEAVIPLNQYGGTTNGGQSVVYNVNVYALNATSETGRMIAESLRLYNRTIGAA